MEWVMVRNWKRIQIKIKTLIDLGDGRQAPE